MDSDRLQRLEDLAEDDAHALNVADETYGDSWRQRGGVGAFMMLARKWDRIENQAKALQYNIFHAVYDGDFAEDGILDDIRDLRRYLLLVEEHVADIRDCCDAERMAAEGYGMSRAVAPKITMAPGVKICECQQVDCECGGAGPGYVEQDK